jgi:hypothetical protein
MLEVGSWNSDERTVGRFSTMGPPYEFRCNPGPCWVVLPPSPLPWVLMRRTPSCTHFMISSASAAARLCLHHRAAISHQPSAIDHRPSIPVATTQDPVHGRRGGRLIALHYCYCQSVHAPSARPRRVEFRSSDILSSKDSHGPRALTLAGPVADLPPKSSSRRIFTRYRRPGLDWTVLRTVRETSHRRGARVSIFQRSSIPSRGVCFTLDASVLAWAEEGANEHTAQSNVPGLYRPEYPAD